MNVSVVIPTFNSANFLAATLVSVINQTLLPTEVVVADDGSTDDTVTVAEQTLAPCEISWRILRCPHSGPGATRNAGINAAKGRWIAFLDSDDLWYNTKIYEVAKAQRRHPEANFFCHAEEHRRRDGVILINDYGKWYRPRDSLPQQLFRRNFFSTSAVVCDRELLVCHDGFDTTFPSSQDYELWLRLSPHLRVNFVSQVLGCYIDRADNITSRGTWRRLRHQLRALHRHREKVGSSLYMSVVAKAISRALGTQVRNYLRIKE